MKAATPGAERYLPTRRTLPSMRSAVQACRGCPLYRRATQAVFGAGARAARMVLVGEQPGNDEDLRGLPFVGPAGKELDRALAAAGIDRTEVYVTNIVKHFKWEPGATRRMHKKPSASEVDACRPWVREELAVIKPSVLVCLGATAAQALIARSFRVTVDRGKDVPTPFADHTIATIHPSSILRQRTSEDRARERAHLIADLKRAATFLGVAALLATGVPARVRAQRVNDTVFIVPGSHLDLGFTAPISMVRAQRIAILDRAIAAAERDRRFVWFEEGGWSVEAWLDHYRNDPARIARLRALVLQERIGVGATMLSPHSAAFPMAMRFLTMHLDRIERELGRRPTVAAINDVPAIPESLVDVLVRAGIHDLMMGPNLRFSAPLLPAVTRDAFRWTAPRREAMLTSVDENGYTDALSRWLLPPECLRVLDPRDFPASLSDDSILTLGVGGQLAKRQHSAPLQLIQHALDNGDPACAAALPDAVARWNRRAGTARLVLALPQAYFQHRAAAAHAPIAERTGEWGGDWDLLRASEPVWSWRLREAISRLTSASPRDARVAAVMVTDHNVGLGPRWQDGTPAAAARQHIGEVVALYRRVVLAASGAAALTAQPRALVAPAAGPWPASWTRIVGDHRDAARVRASPAFIFPFVTPDAAAVPSGLRLGADSNRLVIHTAIDRVAIERMLGPRYQAVIDVTLRAPRSALTIAPLNSPSARAGRWLLGTPAERIVAPEGVRITGPGWTINASGPLLLGWTLVPDVRESGVTHLQALAVVHAVDGVVADGARLRLPFAEAYPGEPATPQFDLELRIVPVH